MMQAGGGIRLGVVGTCLAAASIGGVSSALGMDGWVPFAAWVVSMVTAGLAVRGGRKGDRLARFDWMALALVTALAACFRLYQLDAIPNGLWIDEIWTANNADALVRGETFAPFGTTLLSPLDPNRDRQCNLYLYFAWLVKTAFGSGRTGVKMISVLPGILAVPALFLLARSFLNRTAALATAGLFAVSIWHVTLSRWGWAQVLSTTLFVLVVFFVHSGIRTASQRSLLLAGIVSGLSLYTYLAARIGVVAILAFLCLQLLREPRRPQLRLLALYVLGLCLSGLPVFGIWWRDPAFFSGRVANVSVLPAVLGGDLGGLAHNVASHLLMFHWAGDMNPRHNLPGEPMLDPLSGVVFLAGLVAAFRSIRKPESQLCLLWLLVGLLGGILSNPDEAPQAYRTGLVTPACFLLAGMALEALDAFARSRSAGGGRLAAVAVVLLVSASASLNFAAYFVRRPDSRPAWYSSLGGIEKFIGDQVAEKAEEGYEVYIDVTYRSFVLEAELDLQARDDPSGDLERRVHWVDIREPATDLSRLQDSAPRVVFFVAPRNLDVLRARLPGAGRERLANRFGDVVSILVATPPE